MEPKNVPAGEGAGNDPSPASSATTLSLTDAEAEVELFSRFEAELAAAECGAGCDYPDGPLGRSAAGGCRW